MLVKKVDNTLPLIMDIRNVENSTLGGVWGRNDVVYLWAQNVRS